MSNPWMNKTLPVVPTETEGGGQVVDEINDEITYNDEGSQTDVAYYNEEERKKREELKQENTELKAKLSQSALEKEKNQLHVLNCPALHTGRFVFIDKDQERIIDPLRFNHGELGITFPTQNFSMKTVSTAPPSLLIYCTTAYNSTRSHNLKTAIFIEEYFATVAPTRERRMTITMVATSHQKRAPNMADEWAVDEVNEAVDVAPAFELKSDLPEVKLFGKWNHQEVL
ncbi:hypothetical protein PRIPAC_91526 [Pristionchus pacificus]|uniref:Uncharacterized protein n=1 Tax=Pristionchus pacificus TaxID=54126 RepID=A0A2A6BQY4_PRIPA|nr:hypothetical protein PRIPAC_91526 [Pristionchus pacificus]|eukprot:PDM68330.1 hypothetical protein PRIPAC_46374 [Pristionchus pacificus]